MNLISAQSALITSELRLPYQSSIRSLVHLDRADWPKQKSAACNVRLLVIWSPVLARVNALPTSRVDRAEWRSRSRHRRPRDPLVGPRGVLIARNDNLSVRTVATCDLLSSVWARLFQRCQQQQAHGVALAQARRSFRRLECLGPRHTSHRNGARPSNHSSWLSADKPQPARL